MKRRRAGLRCDVVPPPFAIVAGDPSSPCILHVPHASQRIPEEVRAGILFDDHALAHELAAMTDAHTDLIAAGAADGATGPRPWSLVNGLSRLVVDPERFPDEREVMNGVGMGAVYTRTSARQPLRDDDPVQHAELISGVFEPYAEALADLVDARIEAAGSASIIDVHSYPLHPKPYELYPAEPRPQICIGTDETHTPPWLRAAARDAFSSQWDVAFDGPFRGTYVPLRHYGLDARVTSVMLEIRRDLFVGPEGGPKLEAVHQLSAATAALVDAITAQRP